MRLCRYEGWVVVRTLQVSERSLYSMRSFIFSQCRDRRMGVMCYCTSACKWADTWKRPDSTQLGAMLIMHIDQTTPILWLINFRICYLTGRYGNSQSYKFQHKFLGISQVHQQTVTIPQAGSGHVLGLFGNYLQIQNIAIFNVMLIYAKHCNACSWCT